MTAVLRAFPLKLYNSIHATKNVHVHELTILYAERYIQLQFSNFYPLAFWERCYFVRSAQLACFSCTKRSGAFRNVDLRRVAHGVHLSEEGRAVPTSIGIGLIELHAPAWPGAWFSSRRSGGVISIPLSLSLSLLSSLFLLIATHL